MELVRWCLLQWDRVLAVAALVGGALALVLGWLGASSTEFVAKQIPYVVSGGLGGLVLLMVGGTLWLSADFRDEWRALDRLEAWLSTGMGADVGEGGPALDQLEDRLIADARILGELEHRLALLEQAEAAGVPGFLSVHSGARLVGGDPADAPRSSSPRDLAR